MPGYVIHMAVAARLIEEKGIIVSSFQNAFLLGNIIPDAMERTAKRNSHFWDEETFGRLNRIPNLDMFLKKYGDKLEDPFVLGYYTHLLLDNLFVKEYWSQHFELLDSELQREEAYDLVSFIRVNKEGRVYPREEFFSDSLYYGDYDRIYPYIFEKWPFIKLKDYEPVASVIEEIDVKQVWGTLKHMVDKMNRLYDGRNNLVKEELKIFELEHINSLMEKVVRKVHEIMK